MDQQLGAGQDQQQRFGMILGGILVGAVLAATRFVSGNWLFVLVGAAVALFIGVCAPKGQESPRSAPILSRFNFSLLMREETGEISLFFKYAAIALFCFGLSEGILGAVFWSRVHDLEIHSAFYLGLIGSLGSVCRILGMELVLRRGKEVRQDRVVYGSLIGVSLLVILFALVTSPLLAMGLWMVRIFVFAPYFPTHQAVVMERSPVGLGATFLSTAGSLALLGTLLGGLSVKAIGGDSTGYTPFFIAGMLGFGAAFFWQLAFIRSRT